MTVTRKTMAGGASLPRASATSPGDFGARVTRKYRTIRFSCLGAVLVWSFCPDNFLFILKTTTGHWLPGGLFQAGEDRT